MTSARKNTDNVRKQLDAINRQIEKEHLQWLIVLTSMHRKAARGEAGRGGESAACC